MPQQRVRGKPCNMHWRDEGILLAARAHGESSAIIEVFSALHGKHAGVVRGGGSRKMAATLQPGGQLDLTWRARLEDQLGSFTVELTQARAGLVLGDRLALAALSSVCALCRFALPERQPYPGLYSETLGLLDALARPGWLRIYAIWELQLLEETGFGLDLQQCAVTGAREGLAYVSPRTGRAVTQEGAGAYASRLLPLPAAVIDPGAEMDTSAMRDALRLSGHFLHQWLAEANGRALPEARNRLITALD